MFEYYTIGTRVHSSGPSGVLLQEEEVGLSPIDVPAAQPVACATEQPPISQPAMPEPTSLPLAVMGEISTTTRPNPPIIDHLVQKMSTQASIQDASRDSPGMASAGGASLPTPASGTATISDFDDESLDLGMPDVLSDNVAVDPKRSRRQRDCRLHNDPTHVRSIENLVEQMISQESQCTVRRAPPPLPLLNSMYGAGDLSTLESPLITEDDFAAACTDVGPLEVDEGFCEENEDLSWLEDTMANLRETTNPIALRKYGPLRFRVSAEAALRCHNVVRNVPRMRRRKGAKSSRHHPIPAQRTEAV